MSDWKLYYHDGTTFSDDDGDWLEAPSRGVIGLEYVDHTTGRARDSNDFYINPPWGHPWGADQWGVLDLLIETGVMSESDRLSDLSTEQMAAAGVKFGRSVSNEAWRAFMRWMDKDEELPPKHSWYVDERR